MWDKPKNEDVLIGILGMKVGDMFVDYNIDGELIVEYKGKKYAISAREVE